MFLLKLKKKILIEQTKCTISKLIKTYKYVVIYKRKHSSMNTVYPENLDNQYI